MCDADTPRVFLEQWRRARKRNTCTVCRETIHPGDRYHFISGRWDDRWSSFKHCPRCWLLYEAANRLTGGEADLELNCGEEWEDPPEDVQALAFLTREEAQLRASVLSQRKD